MSAYYKATRPDGRDFHSGTIDYAAALLSGEVIRHPATRVKDQPDTYLSVSVEPADCTGFSWPCRLFRVEPVGRVMSKLQASPNKRALSALRVVEELPAHQALGPNGEAVARLIEAARGITRERAEGLRAWDAAREAAWYVARDAAWDAAREAAWYAAWYAAWEAARYAAWEAAREAAWYAAWYAAWEAARYAVLALLVRDRISAEHFATLTQPWREVVGPELVA